MMAKRWLVAAALLLTLGGCGDDTDAVPATVPVPATSSEAPAGPVVIARGSAAPGPAVVASSTRAARRVTKPGPIEENTHTGTAGFVAVVQARMPEIAVDRRDEEIAAIAEQACASLADGRRADSIVAETRTLGTGGPKTTDRSSARELIRLAIDQVCPDQDRRIDEF
jgi:hypothetical protein